MRNRITTMLILTLASLAFPAGAQWQPAEGPLTTRWAKELTPENVHAKYPRPQLVRDTWLNLNGLWDYAIRAAGEDAPEQWDGQILVPFCVESALSGVMERITPDERLWYRRQFQLPGAWEGRRILLHFEAVDWETLVWVNGISIGEHRGGYDRFTFDITDALTGEREQEIIVSVWDPTDTGTQARGKQVSEPQGIWYTPATGIWQTVWIEPVPESHIRSFEIIPDVADGRVKIRADVENLSRSHAIDAVILAEGREIARGSGGREILVDIPDPHLWSPDDPFLYDVQVTLRWWNDPDRVIDQASSYFGMREVKVAPDEEGTNRIHLNGEPVFNIGTLDQGFWPDGLYTAPTDDALRYDIEMTKKLGFNTIRKHVKIEPDRWYYWCDKLGLLVWQDMPSGNITVEQRGQAEMNPEPESARQFENELRALIAGRGSHPCIIMWVIFNEGWGQHDTKRLTDLVRELDPTRLVNSASGWHDRGTGDVHDIHSYPGPACPEIEADRAGVLGEFGGLGLGVDGHTWAERAWGYRGTADSEELTRRYEQLMRSVWNMKREDGLSAAIYTQITDVETECNGLLTYDRAVTKPDVERLAAANQGRVRELVHLTPVAKAEPVTWRYTFEQPPDYWYGAQFDDSSWDEGRAGFGGKGTPGAVINTPWTGSDIWLRRTFTLDEDPPGEVCLYIHHDEDAEVYINGMPAATLEGYTTAYEEAPIRSVTRARIRKGRNVIAVHCRQTGGGQYIDVGLATLVPEKPFELDLFTSGEENAHTYRIPSLLVTKEGTLLAFCEARRGGQRDTGNIDLIVKRSTDGGRTWSQPQVIFDDGPNTCGNPCAVLEEKTGFIWLLMTHNLGTDSEREIIDQTAEGTRTVWITHSRDDGLTWAAPANITDRVKQPDWTWYATGPGVGIQLRRFPHTGRLVIPCDHIEAGTKKYYSHVIYSDNHGRTWSLGGSSPTDQVNECQVIELTDGRLMLNMRNYDRNRKYRAVCVSDNGGRSWSPYRLGDPLMEPICQASLIRYTPADAPGRPMVLFSNPADTEKRVNMTVRLSYDDGLTWPVSRCIYEGSSAYSCLAVFPDGRIGLLSERDNYGRITFSSFTLDWLTDGKAPVKEAPAPPPS
ncbi:MAG: exo-alpha-sialidase [Planctomycetota bacterium]|nr:exo-alpha-sialidase [Planctomycetota bacterium]